MHIPISEPLAFRFPLLGNFLSSHCQTLPYPHTSATGSPLLEDTVFYSHLPSSVLAPLSATTENTCSEDLQLLPSMGTLLSYSSQQEGPLAQGYGPCQGQPLANAGWGGGTKMQPHCWPVASFCSLYGFILPEHSSVPPLTSCNSVSMPVPRELSLKHLLRYSQILFLWAPLEPCTNIWYCVFHLPIGV